MLYDGDDERCSHEELPALFDRMFPNGLGGEDVREELVAEGLDWRYVFPRLHLVRFRKPEEEEGPDWEGYSPSKAFQEEQERKEKRKEIARMQEEMEEAHRDAVEKAREGPPPTTVEAYGEVYGDLPEGWPP